MSVTGVAVVLGALVLLLLRVGAVRFISVLPCVLFGFVLAATTVGPGVSNGLAAVGRWLWSVTTST